MRKAQQKWGIRALCARLTATMDSHPPASDHPRHGWCRSPCKPSRSLREADTLSGPASTSIRPSSPRFCGVLIGRARHPYLSIQRSMRPARMRTHCDLIRNYRKRQSARQGWLADHSINQDQYDEIIVSVRSTSWKIWRPRLYVIPDSRSSGRTRKIRSSDRPCSVWVGVSNP